MILSIASPTLQVLSASYLLLPHAARIGIGTKTAGFVLKQRSENGQWATQGMTQLP